MTRIKHLCTKCAKNPVKISGKTIPGKYVLRSNSDNINYTVDEIYETGGKEVDNNENEESVPHATNRRVSVNRNSIVKEEILLSGSFNDYYEIFETRSDLGKGSYGNVIKAIERNTGHVRAIKCINKAKIDNIGRLKREITIMKRLDHPCIIRLFNVYEDDVNLYLIMELCTGGELFDRILKAGSLSERYTSMIMRQLLSSIAYCHKLNIMHRDIKPENILFADKSPSSPIKVIDWGFAAQCSANHTFSSVVGTPYYVAPEILIGNYTILCDLWSTGVVLYILLSGYPPFQGKNNKEILEKVKKGSYNFDMKIWKKVSDPAKDLVRRLLTFDPDKRIRAADALKHPWILFYTSTTCISHDSIISRKLGNELINKFKLFKKASLIKKLALSAVAYQLAENDIIALHNLFTRIDRKSRGTLNKTELLAALNEMGVETTEEVQSYVDSIDLNGNGYIEYTEFIAACLDCKFYEQENITKAAFKVFDKNDDGKITGDELFDVIALTFSDITKDEIDNLMTIVCNKDTITYEEFIQIMKETGCTD